MYLVDTGAGPEIDLTVIKVLDKFRPALRNYYNLRTRRSGSSIFVDLGVELCGVLTFGEGHQMTEDIEAAIVKVIPGADVIIHPDPCESDCEDCEVLKSRVAGE